MTYTPTYALSLTPLHPPRSVSTQRRKVAAVPVRKHWSRIFAKEAAEEEPTAEETVESVESVQPVVESPPRTPLSKGMKEKMRREYVGLGGSENVAMGQNWFLVIGLGVAVLAVAAYLTGAI